VNGALRTFAIAVFVVACGTPAPSATPVAPAAPSPSSASATDVAPGIWQRVELPHGDDAFLAAVAATAHDVVIVGGRAMAPAAWASHDGGAWMFEQLGPEDAFPGSAVAFGDHLLAVGGNETNRCAHPFATFFWVRDAKGRWKNAPFNKLFCAGGSGVVAVSGGRLAMLGAGTGDVPFSWFSDDGLTWVPSPIRQDVYPRALASVGDGFAALGTFGDASWWFGRSDRGERWTIAPFGNAPFETQAIGLADGGLGFIAWFADAAGMVAAFTSDTGDQWLPTEIKGLSDVETERVVRTAAGYVAFGHAADGPRVLVSRDGGTWRRISGPLTTVRRRRTAAWRCSVTARSFWARSTLAPTWTLPPLGTDPRPSSSRSHAPTARG
jgi:hypothetical protein